MDDVSDLVDLQSSVYDLKLKLQNQTDKIAKYKKKIQRQSQEKAEMQERINALVKSNHGLQEELQRVLLTKQKAWAEEKGKNNWGGGGQ